MKEKREEGNQHLVAAQHTLDQLAQRAVPLSLGIPSAALISKSKLFHKQDVVLEASVEVSFETKTSDDTVVMAVDVGVDAIETLEDLFDGGLEGRRERHSRVGGEDVRV